MPLNFTLHYDDRINDIDDKVGDVAVTPGVGPIYFEPTILPGYRIPDLTASPRPLGITARRFEGYLDTDGRLKNERGGETGMRLWANDPAWNLPRFQYRVTAQLADLFGRPVDWQPFYFDAPGADLEVYLSAYMPKPGQKFGRGPGAWKIVGGDIADGELTLTNEDGTTVGPIAIPNGVTVLVDNGDGTWDVA